VRAVDIAFVGCLVIILVFALGLAAVLHEASLEPTPVPYVTPSPLILR
jgi:hypothetical protein